jgi:hypothetical protein
VNRGRFLITTNYDHLAILLEIDKRIHNIKEECRILGCGTEQTFRRKVSPPSSGCKKSTSDETASVNKTSTRRHIPEDGILHSHRRENLKSDII